MTLSRIAAILLSPLFVAGASQAAPPAAASPAMQVHDLAGPFVEVWDRNSAKSDADFVQDFKATIGTRFPEFYGIERYDGEKTQAQRDAQIAAARAQFPALRQAYIRKVDEFGKSLPLYVKSFQAVFPDYELKNDVYFVHSLGEMDGGKRTFNGRPYFIFGADVMARVHGSGSEAAFFHHELFHDYQVMDCGPQVIWTSLWNEGMAVYVSKALNPSASNADMLLDLPSGMVPDTQKNLARAWQDLQGKLESGDSEAYSGLFLRRGDKTGLPARRGYYLGYLVAQEIGKKYSLQQMAKLECGAAREAVFAAVDSLRRASATTQ